MKNTSSLIVGISDDMNHNKKPYNFIFGHPDIEPPSILNETIINLINQNISHTYTQHIGSYKVRNIIATYLNKKDKLTLTPESIIMTTGAIGGLNVLLKSIILPGEEILVPSPYFFGIEQIASYNDIILTTSAPLENFHLDLESIESNITEKTRALYINSPNNPTGVLYNADELNKLNTVLKKKSKKYGKPIYLIADEVYKEIVYSEYNIPSIFKIFDNSFIVTSYSKTLSLAGERIGYIVLNPNNVNNNIIVMKIKEIIETLYYNAPSLFQYVISKLQGVTVDISRYKNRRDIFIKELSLIGYEFNIPDGAFYLFVKSPMKNDVEFVKLLKEKNILALPGTLFNYPGYFRLSYTTPKKMIIESMNGFKEAFNYEKI